MNRHPIVSNKSEPLMALAQQKARDSLINPTKCFTEDRPCAGVTNKERYTRAHRVCRGR